MSHPAPDAARGPAEHRRCVGLVGIGLLGSAIARRLCERFEVFGHDLDPARVEALGIEPVAPAVLRTRVDRCVLCLPDATVAEEVLFGREGLIAGDGQVRTIIDTTTGDLQVTERLVEKLGSAGVRYVEACVSGSSAEMASGDAVLLAGGEEDDIGAARDVLDALASVVFRLGPQGSGLRAKLAVNLLLGLERLALGEALVFGEALGLSATSLLEVFRAGPASARVVDTKGPKMALGEFAPVARLAQHRKDVAVILAAAARAGLELPATGLHARILDEGILRGLGDADNSAIVEVVRLLARREKSPASPPE